MRRALRPDSSGLCSEGARSAPLQAPPRARGGPLQGAVHDVEADAAQRRMGEGAGNRADYAERENVHGEAA